MWACHWHVCDIAEPLFSLCVSFRPQADSCSLPEVPEDQGLRRSHDGRGSHQHPVSLCWCSGPAAPTVLLPWRYTRQQCGVLERHYRIWPCIPEISTKSKCIYCSRVSIFDVVSSHSNGCPALTQWKIHFTHTVRGVCMCRLFCFPH